MSELKQRITEDMKLLITTNSASSISIRSVRPASLNCEIESFNFVFAQVVPNYAKEKRWASQVEDGLMDGDVVWLSANKQPFMSLYTPSETNTKRAALIVHGLGVHPDWAQVIQPLRVALSEKGWHTLSVQITTLLMSFSESCAGI
jgi:hypothetical protein